MSDPGQTPRRVLVIDDNRAIHDDFRKTLAPTEEVHALDELERALFGDAPAAPGMTMRFDVAFAEQGAAGAAMVREAVDAGRPFSVAFVDMRMPPGWDGVTTIKQLWAIDPELQCVICTAYSDHSWEEILRELGVNDRFLLLRKPFDAAEVCQLACALSEKWRLARRAHLKLEQLRSMVDEQTQALAESEARYALASSSANDGLWDWNLLTGSVFYAPRWNAQLGLPDAAPTVASLAHWETRIHPEDAAAFRDAMGRLAGGVDANIEVEFRVRHTDGQERWMLCRGAMQRRADGRPVRAAGSQTDITNRKVAEAQLRFAAEHDALTGLPNRAQITRRLEAAMAPRADGARARFAVMFVDLDRFKEINDSLGHGVGDALLTSVAARLRASVTRAPDEQFDGHVGRLGGDEFVVVLEGLGRDDDPARVAARILHNVTVPLELQGHLVHPSLSVGIAVSHPGYAQVADLLRDADTALYRAKTGGRGRFHVFTDALHVAAVARWRLDQDLREAIARDEFTLLFQPVVSLATGEAVHVEALIRWDHPTRGRVPPTDFIPLAEETGLITAIGRWALQEACRQARRWRDAGLELPIAVNVASRQFAQPGFFDEVREALNAAAVPPSLLQIEVTEGAAMDPRGVATCAQLAELGVEIHLDDFGTGYSSLSYLTRMPITALKVDRSFVTRLLSDPMSAAIVRTVVLLASSLGMEVVAEGVECAEELEALLGMGCPCGQGYFWSRPLPADEAFAYARTHRLAHSEPPARVAAPGRTARTQRLTQRMLRRPTNPVFHMASTPP
ncbi:MAG: EAL domain-containing protein [Polyangiales bacterium]